MGIVANGVALPDPQKMSYQVGDLDTSGSRDATGLLHRAYVATKINFEMSWNGLEWAKLQEMLAAVNTPKFTLTAPDPRTFTTTYTGDYYVGDRTGDMLLYKDASDYNIETDDAVYSLKLKFIEY
jgi:hypothetical protein